jgi:hypothetical protein
MFLTIFDRGVCHGVFALAIVQGQMDNGTRIFFWSCPLETLVEIDAIGIEVAQQIELSGCATKANLLLKMHFYHF